MAALACTIPYPWPCIHKMCHSTAWLLLFSFMPGLEGGQEVLSTQLCSIGGTGEEGCVFKVRFGSLMLSPLYP